MKRFLDRKHWYAMHRGEVFVSKLLFEEEADVFKHAGWIVGDHHFPTKAKADAYLAEWQETGSISLASQMEGADQANRVK